MRVPLFSPSLRAACGGATQGLLLDRRVAAPGERRVVAPASYPVEPEHR